MSLQCHTEGVAAAGGGLMRAPVRLTFRPRERRLLLITGGLISCWGLISWVVQPLWSRVSELGGHVTADRERLDADRRALMQGPRVERDYQALAAYIQTDNSEVSRAEFLKALEALSQSAGVTLNLKPRPVKVEQPLSRFEVELEARGSQERLLGFLDALLRMGQLLTIDRLRIDTLPTSQDLRATLVVQRYAFTK